MTKSRGPSYKSDLIRKRLLNRNNSEIIKILRRKDFLAVGSGLRVQAKGLNLQAKKRPEKELAEISELIRVGFTCSKKVGNAVKRNKAKRRLRHLARECLPHSGKPGWDYILIGHHRSTEKMNFIDLKNSLIKAISQIHNFKQSD